jgi:hypothetical protein
MKHYNFQSWVTGISIFTCKYVKGVVMGCFSGEYWSRMVTKNTQMREGDKNLMGKLLAHS